MNCADKEQTIYDLLFGEISEECRKEIEAHLQTCLHCKEIYEEQKALIGNIELSLQEPELEFTEEQRTEILESKNKKKFNILFFSLRMAAVFAFGLFAGLVIMPQLQNDTENEDISLAINLEEYSSPEFFDSDEVVVPESAEKNVVAKRKIRNVQQAGVMKLERLDQNKNKDSEIASVSESPAAPTLMRMACDNARDRDRVLIDKKNSLVYTLKNEKLKITQEKIVGEEIKSEIILNETKMNFMAMEEKDKQIILIAPDGNKYYFDLPSKSIKKIQNQNEIQ